MRRCVLLLLVALLLVSACTYNVELAGYRAVGGVYPVATGEAVHDAYPTPTPESVILPTVASPTTPEPARTCVVLAHSGANVRSGAGTQHEVIAALRFNARVEYVAVDGEWIEIVSPVGAWRAWVYGALVECEG